MYIAGRILRFLEKRYMQLPAAFPAKKVTPNDKSFDSGGSSFDSTGSTFYSGGSSLYSSDSSVDYDE